MRMLTSNQQITYGALLSYIGIFVYILVGLLYTPWMIRIIGADDYGLYTLAYSVITFFMFDFGLSLAIQRFVAKYLAEENIQKVQKLLGTVYKIYICIDIFISILLIGIYFCIPYIYRELTIEQIERFKVVYVIVALYSVVSFPFVPLNGILSAYEKFVPLKLCDILQKVLIVCVSVVCLQLGGGLYALVLTNAIVGLCNVIIKLLIVRHNHIYVDFHQTDNAELKSILSFSGWTTVVSVCQRLVMNIAPSILAIFVAANQIGKFGIAISLEGYTYTFAAAMTGLFLPKISRLLCEDKDIFPLMVRVGRIQLLLLGGIMIGFCLLGRNFIQLWLGPDFNDSFLCTLLLIMPIVFTMPADIADQTLVASGNVKYRAYVYVAMFIVNLLLSLVLTRKWGIQGMAVSISLAYMVRTVCLYLVYNKVLKLNVLRFFYQTYIRMLPGLLLSGILTWFIIRYINVGEGWLEFLIKAVILVCVHIGVCWMFCLQKDEKELVISTIRKQR